MHFLNITIRSLILLSFSMLAACNEVDSPKTPDVAPVSSIPVMPTAAKRPEIQILYAQTGTELTPKRLIKEPKSEVGTAPVFYAIGVFKGEAGAASNVKLRIVDAQGMTVYEAEQAFTPSGENPVLFEIVRANTRLVAGNYKVFFDLDRRPCWELPLTLG
jgi:hypothetical protein